MPGPMSIEYAAMTPEVFGIEGKDGVSLSKDQTPHLLAYPYVALASSVFRSKTLQGVRNSTHLDLRANTYHIKPTASPKLANTFPLICKS